MDRPIHYILDDDGEPVPADMSTDAGLLEWAEWFSGTKRILARTETPEGVTVSTVFLGLDHSYMGGPPVLWETKIFGGEHDGYTDRYTSRLEAFAGHERAAKLVTKNTVQEEYDLYLDLLETATWCEAWAAEKCSFVQAARYKVVATSTDWGRYLKAEWTVVETTEIPAPKWIISSSAKDMLEDAMVKYKRQSKLEEALRIAADNGGAAFSEPWRNR